MPEYYVTARIVLYKDDKRTKELALDAKEYVKLNAEMLARGYVRHAVDDVSQVMYKLPSGEYNIALNAYDGAAARSEALALASAAATTASSKHRFSAYVTGDGGRCWTQLEPVRKALRA